jgi:choline dehydrogenase-like flavoprotein
MNFDVITVGGGLAGSTLATELARAGHKVLVLERETRFKDRVRGENMLPWGVAAARRSGLVDDLLAAGGHQPRYWITYMFGNPDVRQSGHQAGSACENVRRRSLIEHLSPQHAGSAARTCERYRSRGEARSDSRQRRRGARPGSNCNFRARRQPIDAECTSGGRSRRANFTDSQMGRVCSTTKSGPPEDCRNIDSEDRRSR